MSYTAALQPAWLPALMNLSAVAVAVRWALNFNGVNTFGRLTFRAINPDGDIDIEFKTGPEIPPAGCCIIDQSLTNNFAQKEFYLQLNTGRQMQPVVGGAFLSSNTNTVIEPNATYRVTLIGTQLRYYKNGTQTQLINVTRGSFREPNAVTKVGAWSSNAGFGGFYRGHLYDIKINGTLWPTADQNQPIQLPSPSGLGAELYTQSVIENPSFKGSQWTYLGSGRWQLSGDGTYNEIIFSAVQPRHYVLEFEIESISGGVLRCFSNSTQTAAMSPHLFSSVGKHKFVLTGNLQGAYQSFVRHTGTINCIIKNISLKPLVSASTELVVNGDFSSSAGWNIGTNAVITNGELQINSSTVTTTYRSIATKNDGLYELTFTIKSISSGSVRAILYGNGVHYVGLNRAAVGTYTELVQFNTPAGSFNNSVNIQGGHMSSTVAVIDNVSVREVTSYCNPLVLSNVVSEQWQEIPA